MGYASVHISGADLGILRGRREAGKGTEWRNLEEREEPIDDTVDLGRSRGSQQG